jgi:hypothetical protein
MTAADAPGARHARPAEFRYGIVFGLTLAEVVWQIVGPGADWSVAVAFALQGAALVVVVATSRAREDVRRVRTVVGSVLAAAVVGAIAAGALPGWLQIAGGGLLSFAIPFALAGGLLRLVRARGVTLQVVAGALAIYLLVGLTFAWAVGFVARVGSAPYFAGAAEATQSSRVYFSFTTLTTTGYGDYTPATSTGHALAVVEMLVGQLYLVTVIGVLVGSFGRRRA